MRYTVDPDVELDWSAVLGTALVVTLTGAVNFFYIDNQAIWLPGIFIAGSVSSFLASDAGCSSNSAAVGVILPPVCFLTGVILWEILFGGIDGKEAAVASATVVVGGLPFLVVLLVPLGLFAYISAATTDYMRQNLRRRAISAGFR